MNSTNFSLLCLSQKAAKDIDLRKKLIATQYEPDPMDAFCRLACNAGCPLTVGELFAIGLENSDNQCKSTNGGNPSPYESFCDEYENFISELK